MPQAIYPQQGGGGNRSGGVGVGIGVGGNPFGTLFGSAVQGVGNALGGSVQGLLSEAIMGQTPAQVAAELQNAESRAKFLRGSHMRGQSYEDLVAANPDLGFTREEYGVHQKDFGANSVNAMGRELEGLTKDRFPQYAPVVKDAPQQAQSPAEAPAEDPSLTNSLISADGSAPAVDAPKEDMSMEPIQVTPEAIYSPTNDLRQAGPAGGMETGGGVLSDETSWNIMEHSKSLPRNLLLDQVARETKVDKSMRDGKFEVALVKYQNALVAQNSQQQTSMNSALQSQQATELFNSVDMVRQQLDNRSMALGIAPAIWETKPASYPGAKYDMNNPTELDYMRAEVAARRKQDKNDPQIGEMQQEIDRRQQAIKDGLDWEKTLTGTQLRQVDLWSQSVIVKRPANYKAAAFKYLTESEKSRLTEARDSDKSGQNWQKIADAKEKYEKDRAEKTASRVARTGIAYERLDLANRLAENVMKYRKTGDERADKQLEMTLRRGNAAILKMQGVPTERDLIMLGAKSSMHQEAQLGKSLESLSRERIAFDKKYGMGEPTTPSKRDAYRKELAEITERKSAIEQKIAENREAREYTLKSAGAAAESIRQEATSLATSDPVSNSPRTAPEYYEELGVDFGDMSDQDQVTTSTFIDTMLKRSSNPNQKVPSPREMSDILNNPAARESLKKLGLTIDLNPANVSKVLAAYREAHLVNGVRD